LPLPENAISFGQSIFITIKGVYVPKFIWTNFNFFIVSFILAIIVSFFIFSYAKKQRENYGKHFPAFWVSLGIIILFSGSGFLFGIVNLTFEYPEIYNLTETVFNYRGGVTIIPELLSLLLALSLYTSTFIAENVRAGILGVGKGQKEASSSLGLTPTQTLRLVVLPQALRIIIPPTTNQYLNLTKNSSLAAAIAYPDLVLVFAGTALNQTGRAIEIITITMGTYLTLSILISIFMNWYNKRIEIKEK
jgi:general L-amino acid transport system permease protein